jgi:transposase
MKQYAADFRDRLRHALDAGRARAEAARTFGVTDRTSRRWQRQRRATGSVAPKPRLGRRLLAPAAAGQLLAQVRAQPDATLAEHCAGWDATHGVRLSPATRSRALRPVGWSRKTRR